MKAKYYIKNLSGLTIPKRANASDAGYDVVATSEPKIVGDLHENLYKRIDYIEYETNIYISPQPYADTRPSGITEKYFHTDLRPRSSISKYNLVLANSIGLIDRGYKNQVLVRFKYIWNPEDYKILGDLILGMPNMDKVYKKGERICQLVPMETHDIEFVPVDYLDGEDRGGGFGSTDKIRNNKLVTPPSSEFTLIGRITIDQAFKGADRAKVDMLRAYCANFPGEIYSYHEKGMRGVCIVDASGTVLNKILIEPI
jgi:dUTPase